jgi:predicted peroxiredoxin
VEDNVMNAVKETFNFDEKHTLSYEQGAKKLVEDTIENGVKETSHNATMFQSMKVEDTIENGVKETKISPTHTEYGDWLDGDERLDDIIENGVKETHFNSHENKTWVDGVIKGGVKKTLSGLHIPGAEKDVNHIIENGVIETLGWDESIKGKLNVCVSNVVKNGVRETKTPGNGDLFSTFQWMNENKTESVPEMIDDIIENGVKGTIQCNWADPNQINEVIKEGVKKIKPREDAVLKSEKRYINEIIQSGVKSSNPRQYVGEDIIDKVIDKGVNETYYDVYQHKGRIDGVIKNGVKKTKNAKGNYIEEVEDVIENGVKETKKLNEGVVDWIGDIIENGIKEIKPLPSQTGNKDWSEYSHGREDRTKPFNDYLNDTLEMGVKIK